MMRFLFGNLTSRKSEENTSQFNILPAELIIIIGLYLQTNNDLINFMCLSKYFKESIDVDSFWSTRYKDVFRQDAKKPVDSCPYKEQYKNATAELIKLIDIFFDYTLEKECERFMSFENCAYKLTNHCDEKFLTDILIKKLEKNLIASKTYKR